MVVLTEAIINEYTEKGIDFFCNELELPSERILEYGLEFEKLGLLLPAIVLYDYCIKVITDENKQWEIQSFKDRCFMKYYKDEFFLQFHYSQEFEFDLSKAHKR